MDGWLTDTFLAGLLAWVARTVVGVLDGLWGLLSATVFLSPDVTRMPQVAGFAGTSLTVVNTCYVLAFLWAALLVVGRDTVQSRYGPAELIPRLIVGLVGANFALPICSALITTANAVTAALTGRDVSVEGSVAYLRAVTAAAIQPAVAATSPEAVLLLLIGVLIAGLTAALLMQWIVRCGLLVVAVAVAPIALALHGTPQTEGAAKLWWRTLLATLGTVVAQAETLHISLSIFLDPAANLPVGMPVGGQTMNLLVVACLLWAVVKIPGLMSRYVLSTRSSLGATVMRVVAMHRVVRQIRP